MLLHLTVPINGCAFSGIVTVAVTLTGSGHN